MSFHRRSSAFIGGLFVFSHVPTVAALIGAVRVRPEPRPGTLWVRSGFLVGDSRFWNGILVQMRVLLTLLPAIALAQTPPATVPSDPTPAKAPAAATAPAKKAPAGSPAKKSTAAATTQAKPAAASTPAGATAPKAATAGTAGAGRSAAGRGEIGRASWRERG